MPNLTSLVVRIIGDSSGLNDALRKSQKELTGLSKIAGNIFTGIGFGGLVFGILDITSAAREQENVLRTLGRTIDNTGVSFAALRPEILATTAALEAKTKFADQEQQMALTRLIVTLGSYDKAIAALPAVLDAATVSGTDLHMMSLNLGMALSGHMDMVRGLGIEYQKTATFEERLAQTMALVGGAAEANSTKTTELNTAFRNFKEAIGTEFQQTVDDAAAALANLLVVVSGEAGGKKDSFKIPGVFELIARGAKITTQAMKDIAEAPTMTEAWAEIRDRQIAALEELTAELTASTTGVGKLSKAEQALADFTGELTVKFLGGVEAQRLWAQSGDLMIEASETLAASQGELGEAIADVAIQEMDFSERLSRFAATRGWGVIDTLAALETGWSAQADAIRATTQAAEGYHTFVEQELRAAGTIMQPFGPASLSPDASRLAATTARGLAFNVSQGALTREQAAQRVTNIASGAIVINGFAGDAKALAAEIGRLLADESRTM